MSDTQDIRENAIEMLAGCNPRFHLTVVFPRYTFPKQTQDTLNAFLTELNKDIFKKYFENGESFLKGYCVREKTPQMSTVHYHMLIADSENFPNEERFRRIVDRKVSYIKSENKRNYITRYSKNNFGEYKTFC